MSEYYDCSCPTCGRNHRALNPAGTSVTIPRAQLEAYEGAANVLFLCEGEYAMVHIDTLTKGRGREALAALRAAGIQKEGEGK